MIKEKTYRKSYLRLEGFVRDLILNMLKYYQKEMRNKYVNIKKTMIIVKTNEMINLWIWLIIVL